MKHTKITIIFALSFAYTGMYGNILIPSDQCALIVASDTDYIKATEYAENKVDNKKYLNIYSTTSGRYAVSIGFLKDYEAKSIITKWKKSGKIPHDSFCAKADILENEMPTYSKSRTHITNSSTRQIDQEIERINLKYQREKAKYNAHRARLKNEMHLTQLRIKALEKQIKYGNKSQSNNSFNSTTFTPPIVNYSNPYSKQIKKNNSYRTKSRSSTSYTNKINTSSNYSSGYSPSSYSNTSDNSHPYKSSSGNRYKYDLSTSSGQINYTTDPSAKVRDMTSTKVLMDRTMGEYGGGIQ